MGASIPRAGATRGAAFAVASAVLFAVLAVLWLLAARGDRPEYRRPSRLFVAGTAACAVQLAGTALLPADARVPAWGVLDVVYLAGFATVLLTTDPADEPGLIITEALTERFGAFIIIVLGETLTGVVTGLSSRPVSGLTLAVGLAAVVVGFGAWWTGGQRAMDTRSPAADRRDRRDGRRDGQPRRPRPGRPYPGHHGVGARRGRRGRAGRDDAAGWDPAGLGSRPRPVPAARPHLHRLRRGLPRPRRRPAGATSPRPRARPPPQHPLGICRRAPPGRRGGGI
ncbi:MAG: low temperature requirement protein A [Trebonia sp.]